VIIPSQMKLHLDAKPAKTAKMSSEFRFSSTQCDALFAAVLAHDDIDLDAKLPDTIKFDYTPDQLDRCYGICKQLWKEGTDRNVLLKIVEKIRRNHSLSHEDQLTFRFVRAKNKHLRFAFVVCDERHRYPRLFHWMTAIMGNLQDAFKNKQYAHVERIAVPVRFFLSCFVYALIGKEIDGFRPSATQSFRRYVHGQLDFIRLNLARDALTSKEFHEVRKVISRLVAHYDNLKILYPSADHSAVSRYLGTINGLMGNAHDEMVAKKFDKTHDYYADTFALPEEIRQRLTVLVEHCELQKND